MTARLFWNYLTAFCAAVNAIYVAHSWYVGDPAWWFVWISCIALSIEIAGRNLSDALSPQETARE